MSCTVHMGLATFASRAVGVLEFNENQMSQCLIGNSCAYGNVICPFIRQFRSFMSQDLRGLFRPSITSQLKYKYKDLFFVGFRKFS